MSTFYAGLDLGQAQDYTALSILERVAVQMGEPGVTRVEYHVRDLKRPNLGTPYPAIVKWVCALLNKPPLRDNTALIVDATGVGRAVIDQLREAHLTVSCLVPITITGSDSVSHDPHTWEYRVPKRELVGVLQVLLQAEPRRLKIAEGLPLGKTLAAEMLNFKVKISISGHDTYEAGPAGDWREGAHDDLVLATTLPCWYAEQSRRYGGGIPLADEPLPGEPGYVAPPPEPTDADKMREAEERIREAQRDPFAWYDSMYGRRW